MHGVVRAGWLLAGRYRLEAPIGRGAMGVVWRGRDELLERAVAVKEVRVPATVSRDDAEIVYQRTLREARTAARLNHPGVVTVFDVVDENGSPWIVMALVQARALDRIVTEDGPLPPLAAARVGECLLSALRCAHSAGVLHRDVKPSNVLIDADGGAVLTDFGIATFEGDPGLTQVGMVIGTPGFTAPERLRGHPATPASDLWSLGATLYAAVEGRGPFDRAGGPAAVMAGIASENAPRAPSAGPLMPVIDALLRADPDARPDAATAARLLTEAAEGAQAGHGLPGYPWPYGIAGASRPPGGTWSGGRPGPADFDDPAGFGDPAGLSDLDGLRDPAGLSDPGDLRDPVGLSDAEGLRDPDGLGNPDSLRDPDGLRDPAGLLSHPDVREHLDWDQPIGLLLCGILHYILDEENPAEIVETLYRGLPTGSYVFIHHMLDSEDPASAILQAAMQKGLGRTKFRTFAQIRELFGGLELVEPGVVLVPGWRPDPGTPGVRHHPVLGLAAAGVARKA